MKKTAKNICGQSNKFRLLVSFYLIIIFLSKISAQNDAFTKLRESVIGISLIDERLPEGYNYNPIFFTARWLIYEFSSERKGSFRIVAEPQFVINWAPEGFENNIEFGTNFGIQYFYRLTNQNALGFSISAGPHYHNLSTAIQAKGFIFSDNFELGYYQKWGRDWGVTVKTRFRHLSNAGLKSPNIGIDNFFLMLGIFWDK